MPGLTTRRNQHRVRCAVLVRSLSTPPGAQTSGYFDWFEFCLVGGLAGSSPALPYVDLISGGRVLVSTAATIAAMSVSGTAAYGECNDLPDLVRDAVELARASRFPHSCLPQQGELLRVLARGVGPAVIGEKGAGCGLAWLATGAHPDSKIISIERDHARAAAAAHLFRDHPAVEVHVGHWTELHRFSPFQLLVLDGGGQGKQDEPPLEPQAWLSPGGLLVMDDFTPTTAWPPRYEGRPDASRLYWLDHPQLRATQVNVTPDSATILATYIG
jgi:predicted O-methyltransferase YrrM